MNDALGYCKFAGGGIAAVLTFLYGGFDVILGVLMAMVILDYVSGVLGAIYTGTLSSSVGYKGIIKKIGILLVVAVAHIIGQAVGFPEIRSLVIGFYIVNEGISFIENWASVGLPIPQQLKDALEKFKDKDK